MKLFRTDQPLTPSWSLVNPGIELVKQNIWPLFYLSFLPSLIAVVGLALIQGDQPTGQVIQTSDLNSATLIGMIVLAVGAFASLLCYPGVIYLQARAIRGERPTAGEAFKQGLPRLFPFIGMSILQSLIVFVGFLLFIIPGLIMVRGLFMAPYYLIDEKLGPIEALKKSYEASKPHAGWIWGVIGVTIVFSILSSVVGYVPVIGYILSLAASYLFIFGPALRYGEIAKNIKVVVDK